ncbi:MAG: hypothetical protein H7841_09460 [Magnetospirillum sp. WYHS-4]
MRFLGLAMATVLAAGAALAAGDDLPPPDTRPLGKFGCPTVIEGKWVPFSRGTDEEMGDLEVKENSVVLGAHGEIPFKRHYDDKGREYWELLTPFKAGTYMSKMGKWARLHFPEDWQTDPISACLLAFEVFFSEVDALKQLQGRRDYYGTQHNFISPQRHYDLMHLRR